MDVPYMCREARACCRSIERRGCEKKEDVMCAMSEPDRCGFRDDFDVLIWRTYMWCRLPRPLVASSIVLREWATFP